MKLVNIEGRLLLINDDMNRMAKDLPIGTLVFCIDEFFSGHPEIRLSTVNDNCYGCQPIVASTHLNPPFDVSEEVLNVFKTLPDLDIKTDDTILYKPPVYTLQDIELAYKSGNRGERGNGTLEEHIVFAKSYKNVWYCTATDGEVYIVNTIEPLAFDDNGSMVPIIK